MRPRPRPPVRGRGIFTGTGLIVTGLAATVVALLYPLWSYADRSGAGDADVLSAQTVATRYGPLSTQDREFITKVRLAGLWELPAGELAERKGTSAAVRTAGAHLVEGHTSLDAHVRSVAGRLGVGLPDEPDAQQRQWLATLDAAQGADFDREFAGILRFSHGKVFPLVAQVRAETQNALVRDLADDANATVLDHIEVLEATGLVDFGALARELAATPAPAGSPVPTVDPASAVPVTPSPGPGSAAPLTPAAGSSSASPTYPLPDATSGPPGRQP